ncbi:hypothetical protein IP91_03952 [Pseudoduganella lurida]|uniref:Sel1 repeat family protein n=1 Tax=Pseudoduganella lurida TaxID=1036180 RepID=A0A562R238_9BURK|nr:SEL1-like repeat protein [Pseudoduganella lurida]TWI63111.1 hypothetical protein IP91_03952 [Pseudoduganella lurida]
MANREVLAVIRVARSGDAASQLQLGRLYLTGGASLPCSLPTALYWLARAASGGLDEAWMLIGRHVPAQYAGHDRAGVLEWYARASDAGVVQAAVALGQLLLQEPAAHHALLRQRARRSLEAAANAGLPEARMLLPQLRLAPPRPAAPPPCCDALPVTPDDDLPDHPAIDDSATNLPLARALLQAAPADAAAWQGSGAQARLLAHCARHLVDKEGIAANEARRMRELAAVGGDRDAQLALGLQLAHMDEAGGRVPGHGCAQFKRAVRWLTLAGEQGVAAAWFVLSRIYVKPEFSQRSVREARACLERAAALGHGGAQLECGLHAWRMRRTSEQNEILAAYWLQKAAAQGSARAGGMLARIALPASESGWAAPLLPLLTRELASNQPLLAARIELAALFRLTRAEALLLDVPAADRGHCLVIDIRASHGRSRRRLVLVENATQRQALDRIVRVFEAVDCSLAGPEGNYRQRLYRFKAWLQSVQEEGALLAA